MILYRLLEYLGETKKWLPYRITQRIKVLLLVYIIK